MWQIAQDYAAAELLLRLPGHVPMPAFKRVEDVPLVVRAAQRDPQVGGAPCRGPGGALPQDAACRLLLPAGRLPQQRRRRLCTAPAGEQRRP